MNPYTAMGQARIRQRDIDVNLLTNSYLAGAALAALERQRGWQAEAELEQLLKQHGVTPHASASLVSMLRQAIGAALIRSGERLVDTSANRVLSEMTPAAGALGAVG
jgi:hypothetical protein